MRRVAVARQAVGANQIGHQLAQCLHEPHRSLEVVQVGIGPDFQGRGRLLPLPVIHNRLHGQLGAGAVDGAEDLGAGHTVDRRVVHFEHDGETVRRQPLYLVQALDDIGLPQGAGHVQAAGVQPRQQYAQLAPVAGLGQGDMAHVEFQVEVRILYPVGGVQPQGGPGQFAAKHGGLVQVVAKHLQYLLEAHRPVGHLRLVVEDDGADVHGRASALHLHEDIIHFSELLHGDSTGWGKRLLCPKPGVTASAEARGSVTGRRGPEDLPPAPVSTLVMPGACRYSVRTAAREIVRNYAGSRQGKHR